MHQKNGGARTKHFDFIVIDLICIEIAFLLACFLYHNKLDGLFDEYRNINFVILGLYILILIFAPFHHNILKRGYLKELWRVIMCNAGVMMSLLAILFVFKQTTTYSRVVFGLFAVIDTALMFVGRSVWKNVIRGRFRKGKGNSNAVLMCKSGEMGQFASMLADHNNGYYKFIGGVLLDDDNSKEIDGITIVRKDDILEYVKENAVNDFFILPDQAYGKELAEDVLRMGISVHVVIKDDILNLPNVQVGTIDKYTVASSSISNATVGELIIKRLFDIIVSFIGLIFTGILTIFLAPVIKMQAPGPVFFSQKRVGKNGKIFKMYKFRSMYRDAEERKKELMDQNQMQGLMFKMDNDPRIFPAGKFLRKTSIDEFPQFLNILKGDMSLVGTRPPTLDEYEQYDPHHLSRLAMKPGLTGMWQVSGRSDITDFEEIVRLDNEYIRNFSLGLDIKIMVKTFSAVIMHKGSK